MEVCHVPLFFPSVGSKIWSEDSESVQLLLMASSLQSWVSGSDDWLTPAGERQSSSRRSLTRSLCYSPTCNTEVEPGGKNTDFWHKGQKTSMMVLTAKLWPEILPRSQLWAVWPTGKKAKSTEKRVVWIPDWAARRPNLSLASGHPMLVSCTWNYYFPPWTEKRVLRFKKSEIKTLDPPTIFSPERFLFVQHF